MVKEHVWVDIVFLSWFCIAIAPASIILMFIILFMYVCIDLQNDLILEGRISEEIGWI